jgi:hypothetical protein
VLILGLVARGLGLGESAAVTATVLEDIRRMRRRRITRLARWRVVLVKFDRSTF